MTSGNFSIVPVDSIIIDRENRQRRELKNIEELAQSILERGLINPIVITQDHVLVAGERRLTAHKHLGYDSIAVQFAENLDTVELHLIELEENIKREELDWKDHVRAVQQFHALRAAQEPDWSQAKTAEALNVTPATVSRHLLVGRLMDDGVQEVLEAPKLSTASNYAERWQERRKASTKRDLMAEITAPDPTPTATTNDPVTAPKSARPTRFADIQNTNFLSFAQTLQTEPFNFLHCDFPYGVNAGDKTGQSSAKNLGGYEDTAEIYWELLDTLLTYQDNFVSPSAHMIFWFSLDYYEETIVKLRAADWRVDRFPLIWHKSDNAGIIPDANRGPRRTYETALFCTRGDRKIVRAVANSYGGPTTKQYHMSEKPEAMLTHFMKMLVDDSSHVLDPTCGSGMAIKVAETLGAARSLGLEINPDYVERARDNLQLD